MPEASGWRLRNNTSRNAGVRPLEHPAPTLYFGARLNKAVWEYLDPDDEETDDA